MAASKAGISPFDWSAAMRARFAFSGFTPSFSTAPSSMHAAK